MPSVLDTPERLADVDVHDLPVKPSRFWRPWTQSLRRSQDQRSTRTLRFCVMPHPQTRETRWSSWHGRIPFSIARLI